MFALFMDYIVRPVMWVCSPQLRAHLRQVRYQDAHLNGPGHTPPNPDCNYCQAQAEREGVTL